MHGERRFRKFWFLGLLKFGRDFERFFGFLGNWLVYMSDGYILERSI